VTDAENLGDDAAHFGRGIELALAFATLGGEVPHEVFVCVAEEIIAVGTVAREVEGGVLEDGDKVGEALHHLPAAAELVGVVEVRHVGQLVRPSERIENLLIDLIADVGFALQRDHVGKARAFGDANGRVRLVGVAITDVFHEQEDEDIVLVLAGIHATAQFVAGSPER
jgi:hypothetical protein